MQERSLFRIAPSDRHAFSFSIAFCLALHLLDSLGHQLQAELHMRPMLQKLIDVVDWVIGKIKFHPRRYTFLQLRPYILYAVIHKVQPLQRSQVAHSLDITTYAQSYPMMLYDRLRMLSLWRCSRFYILEIALPCSQSVYSSPSIPKPYIYFISLQAKISTMSCRSDPKFFICDIWVCSITKFYSLRKLPSPSSSWISFTDSISHVNSTCYYSPSIFLILLACISSDLNVRRSSPQIFSISFSCRLSTSKLPNSSKFYIFPTRLLDRSSYSNFNNDFSPQILLILLWSSCSILISFSQLNPYIFSIWL